MDDLCKFQFTGDARYVVGTTPTLLVHHTLTPLQQLLLSNAQNQRLQELLGSSDNYVFLDHPLDVYVIQMTGVRERAPSLPVTLYLLGEEHSKTLLKQQCAQRFPGKRSVPFHEFVNMLKNHSPAKVDLFLEIDSVGADGVITPTAPPNNTTYMAYVVLQMYELLKTKTITKQKYFAQLLEKYPKIKFKKTVISAVFEELSSNLKPNYGASRDMRKAAKSSREPIVVSSEPSCLVPHFEENRFGTQTISDLNDFYFNLIALTELLQQIVVDPNSSKDANKNEVLFRVITNFFLYYELVPFFQNLSSATNIFYLIDQSPALKAKVLGCPHNGAIVYFFTHLLRSELVTDPIIRSLHTITQHFKDKTWKHDNIEHQKLLADVLNSFITCFMSLAFDINCVCDMLLTLQNDMTSILMFYGGAHHSEHIAKFFLYFMSTPDYPHPSQLGDVYVDDPNVTKKQKATMCAITLMEHINSLEVESSSGALSGEEDFLKCVKMPFLPVLPGASAAAGAAASDATLRERLYSSQGVKKRSLETTHNSTSTEAKESSLKKRVVAPAPAAPPRPAPRQVYNSDTLDSDSDVEYVQNYNK